MTVTGTPSETAEVRDAEPHEAAPHASLRERKKLATRLLLRRTAISLVAERGLANVTVEDIAEAADVSPRTFFNYFASKEAVLFSGDPERTAGLRAGIIAYAPGQPPLEALRAVLGADADTVTEELRSLGGDLQEWLRRMKVARQDPHVVAAHAAQMAMTERAVAEGLAARLGADPETDPYPGLLAALAVSAVRACISFWATTSGSVQLGELIDQAFQALASGLPENAALRTVASDALKPDVTKEDVTVNHRKDGL